MTQTAVRVLFVCLGNICRSPQAEILCQKKLDESGMAHYFELESAGTGSWHIGTAADQRALLVAKQHGVDLSHHRAQQVHAGNISQWDEFVAMDSSNHDELLRMGIDPKRLMFMRFNEDSKDVPDPYYGGEKGFENVFNILEENAEHVIQHFFEKYSFTAFK